MKIVLKLCDLILALRLARIQGFMHIQPKIRANEHEKAIRTAPEYAMQTGLGVYFAWTLDGDSASELVLGECQHEAELVSCPYHFFT